MPEMVLLGFGLLISIATWKYAVKPTMLDNARDQLFDLRQIVRKNFLQSKSGLDDPLYKELRDLLNGHLRHTEALTFTGFIAMALWMRKHSDDVAAVRQKHEQRFKTNDKAKHEFITSVRRQAATIMLNYMIRTSVSAIVVAYPLSIWLMAVRTAKQWDQNWRTVNAAGSNFIKAAGAMAIVCIAACIVPKSGKYAAQNAMEECALAC